MLIGQIEGQVLEGETGQPIGTATVAVWSLPDSSLVTGAVTDDEGRFLIDRLRPGRYYVVITFVGFRPYSSEALTLSRQAPKVDLGAIRLLPDTAQLEGIEVTAERETVTFALDRTVYNVKDQPASLGGSATDVLQNVPSVEVDGEGKVSLRGNQNVAILINGKPAPVRGDFLTTFLQQIPSDMIERVEVIPNPSAKYDPDGMAGILNIVLRKDAELGLGGGITLGAATGDKYNASGNLTYQKGKITLAGSYGYRNDERRNEGYDFRENRYAEPLSYLEQNREGTRQNRSHLVNLSADYNLSRQNTLSASAMVSTGKGANDNLNIYEQLGSLRELTGGFDRLTQGKGDRFNMDYRLSFRRVVEPSRHELTTEFRFNRRTNDAFDTYTQRLLAEDGTPLDPPLQLQHSDQDSRENEWTFQLDYTRPLGSLKLETGLKSNLRRLDSDYFSESYDPAVARFVPDVNLNNEFLYEEQVHAGYGILGGSMGSWEAQAGLRVEQALTNFDLKTTGETFDNDYFSLFPSVFVAYKLADTRQVKISYSKRIRRPRTRMLNPFASFNDPLNLFVGNPRLQPEYTHAFELTYQQFSRLGSLSLTPYFRRTVNKFERFKTVDPETGVSTLTFRNFDTSDSYGTELVGSVRFGRGLSGFASFNFFKVITDGSNVDSDLGNDAYSWSTRANISWEITRGLSLQAFYFYRAPMDVAQGHISSFSMANIALQKKVLRDHGTIGIRVSDPFDQMGFRFEVDEDLLYQQGERSWESQVVYLTFSYNFGQAPKRRNRDMEERGNEVEDVGIN